MTSKTAAVEAPKAHSGNASGIPNSNDVFVLAEIGINHNGSLEIAKKLIDTAKAAGCDAVKFQKRTIDTVYTKEVLEQPRESPWGKTQRAQKEGLEFSKAQYDQIDAYCKQVGIKWSASAWDVESQKFLRPYNLSFNKIASPMITHMPLLKACAEEGRHTYISTGMSDYKDIDAAVKIFQDAKCAFTLMHCLSVYPAQDAELNLSLIGELKKRYNCPVGYSGHEVGVLPSVLAVMLGAVAIERHITLDRAMYGSDQSASLEPRGLEIMVRDIRAITPMLGDGVKRVTTVEASNAKKLRYYWQPSN
jgi:N-acetylneuraminate synthase